MPAYVCAIGNQKGGRLQNDQLSPSRHRHLATALAELQRRVLIIDLDANAGATQHFGIPPESYLGTFEVLVGLEQPEDVVIRYDDDEVDLPAHVALMPPTASWRKSSRRSSARTSWSSCMMCSSNRSSA
jgi:chromosome partitioning protein